MTVLRAGCATATKVVTASGNRRYGLHFAAAVVVLLVAISGSAVGQLVPNPIGDAMDEAATAASMLKEAYDEGDPLAEYGNWYGPGLWGGTRDPDAAGPEPPVDGLDAVAMKHDFAYAVAEEQGKLLGPAEEARLKAIADSLAVRDAKKLAADPRNWTPPATDPVRANRFRNRIIFGFGYLSSGRKAESALRGLADWVTGTTYGPDSDDTAAKRLTPEQLEQLADKGVADWHTAHPVQPTFRLGFVSEQTYVPSRGSLPIQVAAIGVNIADSQLPPSGSIRVVLSVVAGPGKLSKTEVALDETVQLQATRRLLGLVSSEGYKISVTARADGSEHGIRFEPATAQFTIGAPTRVEVSASPSMISEWVEEPCHPVTLRARLTDVDDNGIAGKTIHFSGPVGVSLTREGESSTDANGYAEWIVVLCETDREGETAQEVEFTASFAGDLDGSPVLADSSARTIVQMVSPFQGIITVVLVDEVHSKKPVAGAAVRFSEGTPATGVTNNNGAFRTQVSLPEDEELRRELVEFEVSATADGYNATTFTISGVAGEHIVPISPRDAEIDGTVRDAATGEMIAGAQIRMERKEPALGKSVLTGSDGWYKAAGLYCFDTVTLVASAKGYRTYQKTFDILTQFPQVDFQLQVEEPRLQGLVHDAGGRSVAGATVSAETSSGTVTTTTSSSGWYSFTPLKLDEQVIVTVSKEGYETLTASVRIAGLENYENFTFGPAQVEVRVFAVPADPAPGQGVRVTAEVTPKLPGVRISLEVNGTDGYANSVSTVTNAVGRAYLFVPGADPGVLDRVRVVLLDQGVARELYYSF